MILFIKSKIKYLLDSIHIRILCSRYNFKSHSNSISVHAEYGKCVRIGKNVLTTDDVVIGDYSYINRNSNIENCTIGKYCSISENVKINPVEHNLSLITTHPVAGENGHYGQQNKPVTIGNDVLISLNAIILSGVSIGNGAVIAAGAVVTKDVPPYAIVGGVPARIIRYRFDKEKIDMLQTLQWWNWSAERITRNLSFLRGESTDILP